ncbi:hypothetical protein NSQ41_03055 [Aeribacillus sp. FSL K6-8210]|uniref:hypothetical protein n=1 Tax=Aeribacillus sp. FSL K6-8210 TaxID=2954683 RepID=UPI0030CC87C0
MIFVNDQLVVQDTTLEEALTKIKEYLWKHHLIIINNENVPLTDSQLEEVIKQNENQQVFFKAIKIKELLFEIYSELNDYVDKIEQYIDNIRDEENYSSVQEAFANVVEALIEFSNTQKYLDINVIDPKRLEEFSLKALRQTQLGNVEYVLDLMEYELVPLFKRLLKQLEERM